MKSFLAIIIFIFLGYINLFSQSRKQDLGNYMQTAYKNKQFNGNVLVAENGKVVYSQSFGYADFDKKIKNTETTPFVIASISKTLTATAILQLAESGKLKTEDPVKKHLPWFPYDSIRIRHLLSHSSGLPPYNVFFDSVRRQQPGRVFTNDDFEAGILSNPKPLVYKPGERGNYDNINFLVLAILIEKLSGMTYQDYVKKKILDPAGMKHTFFVPMRAQYDELSGDSLAHPYLFPHRYSDSLLRAATVPYIKAYWSAYNFHGFGNYASTVYDLLLYDQAYYNGTLLSNQSIAAAFDPVKLNNGQLHPANFGLGWQVSKDSSLGKLVYHSGNATGLSCVLIRNISRQQAVIVFDNIHVNNSERTGMALLKILNGEKLPLPRKNLVTIYAQDLLKNGIESARQKVYELMKDTAHYELSEDEMNSLGYDFMGGDNNPNPYHFPEEKKYREALETFKLNKELFPRSWNTYDSYGEILLKMGDKQQALEMYKRSVELNPNNEAGKKIVEQLTKKTSH